MTMEEIRQQVEPLMKKYKYSTWAIFACVAIYLACLFWFRSQIGVIATFIPMLILAIYNWRIAKKIRALQEEYARLAKEKQAQEMKEKAAENGDEELMAEAEGVASLNQLPKDYTVLDDVQLDERTVPHVVVSPYGIVVIDTTDTSEEVKSHLNSLGVDEVPVTYIEEVDNVPAMTGRIMQAKDNVLNEKQIYAILYRLSGLDA